MYHIKKDKRSQKSAALIYEGLQQCMQKKPFDQITITDIQRASFVSRATFYRHFDQLSDVLYWRCDQCFAEVLENYVSVKDDIYHFVHYFLDYWYSHGEILELLLAAQRIDIIYDCHMNHMERFFRQTAAGVDFPAEHYPYFCGIRSGIMIGILLPWLKDKKSQSIDSLFPIIRSQIDLLRNVSPFI